MKVARVVSAILSVIVVAPIWYYLVYKILQGINATELMWFLYWIYLPVGIIVRLIDSIVNGQIKTETK